MNELLIKRFEQKQVLHISDSQMFFTSILKHQCVFELRASELAVVSSLVLPHQLNLKV